MEAFTVTPAVAMTWMDAGATHLDPGAYTASILLPRGTTLEHVEVAPPCVMPIEPPGGWKAPAVLLSEHAAVTMVQALDKQSELPPSDAPLELEASQFHVESGASPVAASGTMQESIKGGPGGTRAVVIVELPEAGALHDLRVRAQGRGPELDGRLLPQVRRVRGQGRGRRRHAVASRPHRAVRARAATPSPSSSRPAPLLQRVRAERKKDSPGGLRRDRCAASGSDVGPPGPMPRNRAVDAMRFLEKKAAP